MNMDNIRFFPCDGQDPDLYLEAAKEWDMESVLIIGIRENGQFVWGGNNDKIKDLLFMLEIAKANVIETIKDDQFGE